MDSLKKMLPTIWLPLFALTALCSFYIVWLLLDLPPQEEVIRLAQIYFEKYGLLAIFICAIIEGVLFAGWYFPGSFIIVLAVFLAGSDYAQLFGVFAVTTLGLLIAYMFNFYLGKYGWYRMLLALGLGEPLRKAQSQLIKYGPRSVFLTFWHPNLAALTSTAAGILQMPFRTFMLYCVSATLLWDSFWTLVGFALGETALTIIGPQFVLLFIAGWIIFILIKKSRSDKNDAVIEQTAQQ